METGDFNVGPRDGEEIAPWIMFSRLDIGRRYRGISSLSYELVINQGVTLHCLGKSINTDAVPLALHLKVS